MEKYITDERIGLKYELVGDYYPIAGNDEPEERPHRDMGVRVSGGYLCQRQKHRPSRQARQAAPAVSNNTAEQFTLKY